MSYELVPERIEWHMDLISRMQKDQIDLDVANKLIIQAMADWFANIKHNTDDMNWIRFDSSILDFDIMNPRMNVTILNNKVIHMLRTFKVDEINRVKIEKEINLHFEDMKRIFSALSDESGEIFGWTYGVNPRLSKIYREYKK